MDMSQIRMNDKPESLFCINPIISEYSKRYILGTGREAIHMFSSLLKECIYIDGFVDDDNAGMILFNKKTVAISEIQEEINDTVIIMTNEQQKVGKNYICIYPFVLNPNLNINSVIIYGAGLVGGKILKYLLERGINVEYIIDSDMKKVGEDFYGKKIYSKDKLLEIDGSSTIVEIGKYYKEIDCIVCQYRKDLYRVFYEKEVDMEIFTKIEDGISLSLNFHISQMCQCLSQKNIIIYGGGDRAKKVFQLCKMLDLNIVHLCDDEKEMCAILANKNNKTIEDVFVLVANKDSKADIKQLEKLGLVYAKNFALVDGFRADRFLIRENALDINLAYTFYENSGVPGYTIYGKNREKDYRIVLLGDSTTDGALYPFKTWGEYLYEKFVGKEVTIYNGGVAGYKSSLQIIKLVRDVLNLKPDMILVYDGFNEIYTEQNYPFAVGYLQKLFDLVSVCLEDSENVYANISNKNLIKGIENPNDRFSNWINSIKIMQAIANCFNIKFFSFLQPMLGSKRNRSKREEGIWRSTREYFDENKEIEINNFRKKAKEMEIEKNFEYVFDLSGIFDHEGDVYMDSIHVYEKGNKIIAEEIYNRIVPLLND